MANVVYRKVASSKACIVVRRAYWRLRPEAFKNACCPRISERMLGGTVDGAGERPVLYLVGISMKGLVPPQKATSGIPNFA